MEELDWLRDQGVVMQSARGPVPSLAEHVAGEVSRASSPDHDGRLQTRRRGAK